MIRWSIFVLEISEKRQFLHFKNAVCSVLLQLNSKKIGIVFMIFFERKKTQFQSGQGWIALLVLYLYSISLVSFPVILREF